MNNAHKPNFLTPPLRLSVGRILVTLLLISTGSIANVLAAGKVITGSVYATSSITIPADQVGANISVIFQWAADDYPRNSAPGNVQIYDSSNTFVASLSATMNRSNGPTLVPSAGSNASVTSYSCNAYCSDGTAADGTLQCIWKVTGLAAGQTYTFKKRQSHVFVDGLDGTTAYTNSMAEVSQFIAADKPPTPPPPPTVPDEEIVPPPRETLKADQGAPTITSASSVTQNDPYTATADVAVGSLTSQPEKKLEWRITNEPFSGAITSTGVVTTSTTGNVLIQVRNLDDNNYNASDWSPEFSLTIKEAAKPELPKDDVTPPPPPPPEEPPRSNPTGNISSWTFDAMNPLRTRADVPFRVTGNISVNGQLVAYNTLTVGQSVPDDATTISIAGGNFDQWITPSIIGTEIVGVAAEGKILAITSVQVLPTATVSPANLPLSITSPTPPDAVLQLSNLYPGSTTVVTITSPNGEKWASAPVYGGSSSNVTLPLTKILPFFKTTNNTLTIVVTSSNTLANWQAARDSNSTNAAGTQVLYGPSSITLNVSQTSVLRMNTL